MPYIHFNYNIKNKFSLVFSIEEFILESLGARFIAPINVLNALSTEIISAVRGLKEIIHN
jgi:hypothetical protein